MNKDERIDYWCNTLPEPVAHEQAMWEMHRFALRAVKYGLKLPEVARRLNVSYSTARCYYYAGLREEMFWKRTSPIDKYFKQISDVKKIARELYISDDSRQENLADQINKLSAEIERLVVKRRELKSKLMRRNREVRYDRCP